MSTTVEAQKARLRKYLNPSIKGPNVDIILESLASGPAHLIDTVEAVSPQLYISTAIGTYLDQKLADSNVIRPDNVGLSDDVFRALGIKIVNSKQIRSLIHSVLETMYGIEFTHATSSATLLETYALEDGDTLIMQFDDEDPVEVTFLTSQFTNILSATAQEIADAITRNISKLGRRGSAIAKDDGAGGYVMLISETRGPSSSVKVLGGKAQNKLQFNLIRPTSGAASTQWTLTQISGGKIKATWSGGANPSIGKIKKNDYTTIYGTAFNIVNRGTFLVTAVQGGLVGSAYVEYINSNGISEIVVQGTNEAFLFFYPTRSILSSKKTFACAYQTETGILEIFMPATTKVVRRERKGAAHIHDIGASAVDVEGPYIYDTEKPYLIGGEECITTQQIDANSGMLIQVDDSSEFPDETGHVVLGFGFSKEEGPVPYISRPSSTTLLINPSYRFQNVHAIGTNISLIAQNYAHTVSRDGTDLPFYITDTVSGRFYAEDLIKSVAATGINLIITILYPDPEGLENWTETEDDLKTWQDVWN